MNYIDLLKSRNKALIINGPEGSGKSLLSRQIAGEGYVSISDHEMKLGFKSWLKDKPSVVIVDNYEQNIKTLSTELKLLLSSSQISVELKFKDSFLIDTPFFILNTNVEKEVLADLGRRFVVINIGAV